MSPQYMFLSRNKKNNKYVLVENVLSGVVIQLHGGRAELFYFAYMTIRINSI